MWARRHAAREVETGSHPCRTERHASRASWLAHLQVSWRLVQEVTSSFTQSFMPMTSAWQCHTLVRQT